MNHYRYLMIIQDEKKRGFPPGPAERVFNWCLAQIRQVLTRHRFHQIINKQAQQLQSPAKAFRSTQQTRQDNDPRAL